MVLQAHPRLRKGLIALVAIVALVGIAGFFILPPWLKSVAERELGAVLHREVSIGEVSLNPYALTARIKDFAVREPGGGDPVLAFDELFVNAEAASIFRGGPVIGELTLAGPRARIVRNADGRYNWQDVVDEFLAKPEGPTPKFSVNNIRVTGGRIDFDDRPVKAQHAVTDIELGLPFVSSLPHTVDLFVEPAFAAKVNGKAIALKGRTKPFEDTKETVLDLDLAAIDLPRYMAYVPAKLNYRLTSGLLDAKLAISFRVTKADGPVVAVSGSTVLREFAAEDTEGRPLARLPRTEVVLGSIEPLANRFRIDRVQTDSPEFWVRRFKDGTLQLIRLLPPPQTAGKEKDLAASRPLLFGTGETIVRDGKIHWEDEAAARPFQTSLAFDGKISRVALGEGGPADVELSATTDAGETLKHAGKLTLVPFGAEGTIELAGFKPGRFAPYYERLIAFGVEDGRVDVSASYALAPSEGAPQVRVSNLNVTVSSLRLRRKGDKQPFLTVPALAVEDAEIDLAGRSVLLAKVSTKGGKLAARRAADGSIDLLSLVPPPAAPAKPAASASEPPWKVAVKRAAIEGWGVRFDDEAAPQPVTVSVEPLAVTVEEFSTAKASRPKVQLKATVNRTGSVAASGPFTLEPLSAQLKLLVQNLDLVPFQPYVADLLNVTLTRGAFSLDGKASFATGPDGSPGGSFDGVLNVTDFRTVEKATAADFLNWRSLYIGRIQGSYAPLALSIDEVALSDFYSKLVIGPEGRLNVQDLLVRGPEPSPPPAETPPAAAAPGSSTVRVGRVTLQGGKVDFTDNFIKPNYSASLTELGGRVAGLSSEPGTTAEVEVRGTVANSAPIEIAGRINPLAGNLFLDIAARVNDFELSPLTPYSGKYVGYGIEKGKLSLDLKYRIENRKLTAENRVFLDQLTFGEKVESPDAVKLPVLLAVSLLKNRRGEIDINLPIGGTLDDPKFSVFGIVVQVIFNLIGKALTAPFALLGAAFGGGEELSYVDFEPGRAALAPASQEKLKTLAKALEDRPGLKLEIAGRADRDTDMEGARRVEVENKVKAQKFKDLGRKGTPPASLDEVTVDPAEYPLYLERAYDEEKFPKPRNLVGFAKKLPAPEMEKLMLTYANASDDTLRQLAARRAETVKDYLAKNGKVAPDRMFVVAGAQEKKAPDGAKPSRADLTLK